jgi:hypothetical protein
LAELELQGESCVDLVPGRREGGARFAAGATFAPHAAFTTTTTTADADDARRAAGATVASFSTTAPIVRASTSNDANRGHQAN